MPNAARRRLDALSLRTHESEYAFEQYALKSVHEFSAVNDQRLLCQRYGVPLNRERDEEGLLDAALELFAPV